MTVVLLPCPFCGSPGEMHRGYPDGFFASCATGGWKCGISEMHTYRAETEEKAANAWNRRDGVQVPPAGDPAVIIAELGRRNAALAHALTKAVDLVDACNVLTQSTGKMRLAVKQAEVAFTEAMKGQA